MNPLPWRTASSAKSNQFVMPPRALLILHILADAEPLLTVAALWSFLRVRQEVDLPAMRDYLLLRATWALLLTGLLVNFPSRMLGEIYFYAYWAGAFLLAMLLLRVAIASLDRFLWSFPGLLALRRIGYRWFLIAGSLLTVPVLYALIYAIALHADREAGWWSMRLGGAVGLVEFLAVASVLTVGLRAGLSPRSRIFGILLGLAMEPAANVILTWFARYGLWTWNNLILQIVTDSTLILWIIYLLLPDRGGPLNEPSEAVLRWDQVARWATRHRAVSKEETSSKAHQRHGINSA